MPLGMQVGLDPNDIVLDGDRAPLPKRDRVPNFRPMSIVTKRLHGSRCNLAWTRRSLNSYDSFLERKFENQALTTCRLSPLS